MSSRPAAEAPEVLIDTVPVRNVVFDEAVEQIVAWARAGEGGFINTPNVDHIVRARRDPAFRELVMKARLRLPDGMGIVYGSRIAGTPLRGTVTGRLLPEAIVRATVPDPPTMALLGGRGDAVTQASERLTAAGGRVVAAIAPAMGFELGGTEDSVAVARLVDADPRLLFVGFGSPKQERWMALHQGELPRTLMLGVGQTIDVLGGRTTAAPMWMTRVGLEWFYRVLKSPIKHGKRMLIDDPPFFWWMLKARFRRGAGRRQ